MILATLTSEKVRNLKASNPFVHINKAAGVTVNASIPLHLFFSSDEITALFPLDSSTLQSQIIINVRWKPVYEIFTGDSVNAVTLPGNFNTLYLRVGAQVSISNDFALANQLKMDSALIYSLPGTYIQSFQTVQNVSSLSTENIINLTSMPSGQLQCLLLSAESLSTVGVASTQVLIQPWVQFESIRMLYNGVEIYRADSKEEIRIFNGQMTDRDSGVMDQLRGHQTIADLNAVVQFDMANVVIIPFVNEVSKVLRERRHEHSKDYSGSSLQFHYTLSPLIEFYDDACPIQSTLYTDPADGYAQPTGNYRFNFTFVNSALYEISQQTVSLTM